VVLDMMKSKLGINTNITTTASRNGRKVTYTLSISTVKDLTLLMNFLDSNIPLQGYKYIQYQD
jgi:hypothetical protein